MYEGDSLQILECKVPFSGRKNCIDSLNMVIEMIVWSVWKRIWSNVIPEPSQSRVLVVQVFAFGFYIFVTENHVFYILLKKNNQGLFSNQSAGGFTCQTLTSLNELPA